MDEFLEATRASGNYARAWTGSKEKIDEVSAAYSPLYLVGDNSPPIISIHGTDDSVVPYEQGEALHASLNTPNELVSIKGGNHSGFTDEQYGTAYAAIFEFLEQN